MKHIKKKLQRVILGLMTVVLSMTVIGLNVYALENGAYTVPTNSTYANPETGLIVDGGTNAELGQSMVGSVVSPTALVEVVDGRTFVTIGIGLASNISNTRITVQNQRGVDSYSDVSLTQTGTSWAHDDTVLHFRFEMIDPENLISPIIFVDPMGRDVQFFIRLNMAVATPGTGIFVSEMVPVAPSESTDEEVALVKEEIEPEEVEVEELEADEEGELEEESEPARERRSVNRGEISLEGIAGLTIHLAEEVGEENEGNSRDGVTIAVASIGGLGAFGGGFYLFQKKRGGK